MAEPTQVQDKALSKLNAAAAPSAPVPDNQAVKDKLNQLTKNNGGEGGEDSDSGEDEDGVNDTAGGDTNGVAKKKKKKKPKKKKNAAAAAGGPAMKQTEPPSIGVSKLYPSGQYPVGEVSEYTGE
jgi:methionyl aminopeptidase